MNSFNNFVMCYLLCLLPTLSNCVVTFCFRSGIWAPAASLRIALERAWAAFSVFGITSMYLTIKLPL